MALVVAGQFCIWFLVQAPLQILRAWGTVLAFTLNYFSVGLLLKTLFSPWKGIMWQRKRAFSLGDYITVIFSNAVSRVLGAWVRIVLILMGIIATAIVLVLGALLLIFWYIWPILILIAFFNGIRLLLF